RLTVPLLLHRHASTIPDHPFVVTEDDAITYATLDDRSRAVAVDLVERGITKGTRVGLLMANGIEWAVLAFGVMRIGAVVVPLSTLLTPPELAANLRVAGVEHLVVAPRTRTRDHLADLRDLAPTLTPDRAPLLEPALPRLRSILVA